MRKRRPLTKEIKRMFAEWKANSRKYGNGDPFNEIETIEMYEGVDDKPADAIAAINILEHMPDPTKALREIKGLARKSAAFFIMPDALRSKETWEKIIGQYFPVAQTLQLETGHIWIHCSAVNPFGYKNVVSAGTAEGRWENIISNCKAVSKRITRRPPHNRTAILACYGPSLADNLPPLISEAQQPDCDLISVSGSHDFLIERDIIPDFHVECDPRPHKADNIAKGDASVTYLLGSLVSPVLMEKLKGHNIMLWHPSGEYNALIKDELDPDAIFVGGGGNVGLRVPGLFYLLGYRSFSIYGMDCSFSDDGEQKWAGNHAQKANPVEQKLIKAGVGDRLYTTSMLYITYANAFFDLRKLMPDAEFRVYGDGLLQAMCRGWNQLVAQNEAA